MRVRVCVCGYACACTCACACVRACTCIPACVPACARACVQVLWCECPAAQPQPAPPPPLQVCGSESRSAEALPLPCPPLPPGRRPAVTVCSRRANLKKRCRTKPRPNAFPRSILNLVAATAESPPPPLFPGGPPTAVWLFLGCIAPKRLCREGAVCQADVPSLPPSHLAPSRSSRLPAFP